MPARPESAGTERSALIYGKAAVIAALELLRKSSIKRLLLASNVTGDTFFPCRGQQIVHIILGLCSQHPKNTRFSSKSRYPERRLPSSPGPWPRRAPGKAPWPGQHRRCARPRSHPVVPRRSPLACSHQEEFHLFGWIFHKEAYFTPTPPPLKPARC